MYGRWKDVAMNPNGLLTFQECRFYHSTDLPGIGSIEGDWDPRKTLRLIGSADVRGKTVLDVRTVSGFLAFEAEKREATVFTFDADDPDWIQMVPPSLMDQSISTA